MLQRLGRAPGVGDFGLGVEESPEKQSRPADSGRIHGAASNQLYVPSVGQERAHVRWNLSAPFPHSWENTRLATGQLVFTWQSEDDEADDSFESLVTVDFLEKNADNMELRVRPEDLPTEESRDEHAFGWNSALDNLEILLSSE